ncbi:MULTISPECIES: ATP-binding protein [unclassified Streptomyces]|uniref:ATP-binding protein n=1 Tax=Streptomyces sp. NPDC023588 TaxID=3154907 RepID=UPI0033DE4AE9
MSLPLTRRIARAALLVAAGAAPVVGAAGAASAAGLESVPQLGTLTAPDTADASATATDAVGTAAQTLPAPAADVAGKAGGLLGGLPAVPSAQDLPVGSLTGSLPGGGLPGGGLPGGLPLG